MFYNKREVACKVTLTLTIDGDIGKREIETDPITVQSLIDLISYLIILSGSGPW